MASGQRFGSISLKIIRVFDAPKERAAKIYAIVSNALTRETGLDEVIAFVKTNFSQLRAA